MRQHSLRDVGIAATGEGGHDPILSPIRPEVKPSLEAASLGTLVESPPIRRRGQRILPTAIEGKFHPER
jgi:hypothetical protein